ncbi:MAG: kelch repeat-containing protein, partial [Polyangiaceae bacterium]
MGLPQGLEGDLRAHPDRSCSKGIRRHPVSGAAGGSKMLDLENRNVLLFSLVAAIATATGCGGSGSSTKSTAAAGTTYQGFFTQVGSLATGRVNHTATLLKNGQVLIVGGRGRSGTQDVVLDSAELFNPA